MAKIYGVGWMTVGIEMDMNHHQRVLKAKGHDPLLAHVIDTDTEEILSCPSNCPVAVANLPHGHLLAVHSDGSTSVIAPMSVEYVPTIEAGTTKEWISIPTDEIMQLVGDYTTWVEVGLTSEVCKCQRIVHPNDIDLPEGDPKRRTTRGDTSLECPAHTKEGYLLGFFEWLKRQTPEPVKGANELRG